MKIATIQVAMQGRFELGLSGAIFVFITGSVVLAIAFIVLVIPPPMLNTPAAFVVQTIAVFWIVAAAAFPPIYLGHHYDRAAKDLGWSE